jgi:hypothetical protein
MIDGTSTGIMSLGQTNRLMSTVMMVDGAYHLSNVPHPSLVPHFYGSEGRIRQDSCFRGEATLAGLLERACIRGETRPMRE